MKKHANFEIWRACVHAVSAWAFILKLKLLGGLSNCEVKDDGGASAVIVARLLVSIVFTVHKGVNTGGELERPRANSTSTQLTEALNSDQVGHSSQHFIDVAVHEDTRCH